MTSVDIVGWSMDIPNLFLSMPGTKFWAIDKDQIFIKISESNDPENIWQLWAINVTHDPPTRVYDSPPMGVRILAEKK